VLGFISILRTTRCDYCYVEFRSALTNQNFIVHAIIIIATTGMVKMSVVIIHRRESASPLNLPFSALLAANKAAIPHARAITSANRPRVLHPNKLTGERATAKKSNSINAG
jgi:hypothetical protein